MGRPRKSRAKKQSEQVVLYLTPAEKKKLNAAAERAGLPVATFARIHAMGAT
jgi:hypothetical protein